MTDGDKARLADLDRHRLILAQAREAAKKAVPRDDDRLAVAKEAVATFDASAEGKERSKLIGKRNGTRQSVSTDEAATL